MSEINLTIDADELHGEAFAKGLDEAAFAAAAAKAVRVTVRQLQALGLHRLAQAIGARWTDVRKRKRVTMRANGGEGRVWFGLEPVSASALRSPPAYSFAGPNGSRWARAGRISSPFVGAARGFKDRRGRTDVILKLFRTISSEGLDVADKLGDDADALFQKNLKREIDQTIRRATYAP